MCCTFIDLMLENFSDPRYFPMIDATIKKARSITKFIYNHASVLALMRKEFTSGRDLGYIIWFLFATILNLEKGKKKMKYLH